MDGLDNRAPLEVKVAPFAPFWIWLPSPSLLSQKAHFVNATRRETTGGRAAREYLAWRGIDKIHLTFMPRCQICQQIVTQHFLAPHQKPVNSLWHFLVRLLLYVKCLAVIKQNVIPVWCKDIKLFVFSILILLYWKQSVMVQWAQGTDAWEGYRKKQLFLFSWSATNTSIHLLQIRGRCSC